jgi:hypothetical protein
MTPHPSKPRPDEPTPGPPRPDPDPAPAPDEAPDEEHEKRPGRLSFTARQEIDLISGIQARAFAAARLRNSSGPVVDDFFFCSKNEENGE